MTLKAKVHNGTLVLDQPLALPEGTEVELELHAAGIVPGLDGADTNGLRLLPSLHRRRHRPTK